MCGERAASVRGCTQLLLPCGCIPVHPKDPLHPSSSEPGHGVGLVAEQREKISPEGSVYGLCDVSFTLDMVY